MMLQEPLTQIANGDRREGEQRRRVGGELCVDLRGDALSVGFVVGDSTANLPCTISVIDMPAAVVLIIRDPAGPPA